MKIGTIIILENLALQKVIDDISGILSDRCSIEFLIGNYILEQPHEAIRKDPHIIKIILDKYRTLILEKNSNEEAMKLLVKNWNQYFDSNEKKCNPYKKDFENMIKLINTGMSVFDIFIAINNGMDARTANYLHPDSILWKTKSV